MSFIAPEIIKKDVELSSENQDKRDLVEFLLKLEINDAFIVEESESDNYIDLAKALGITLKSKDRYEGFRSWKVQLKRID